MIVTKVFLCFVVVLLSALKVFGVEENGTKPSFTGFGFEIIMAKLEFLQYKLIEMESAMKEDRETIEQKLCFTSGLNLRSVLFPSCKKNPSNRSGKYFIQPTENDEPFLGYCEQTAFGGGWLVFQHRYDGSVDFYRNWTEYRNGFGSVDGEFWLGLERLNQITSERKHELLVELKDFEGNYKYARYSEFEIGSEAEQYSLKKLGSYTGTAGDSLTYHKGMKFTTKDRDNDESRSMNGAEKYEGAWWYKEFLLSNLNGRYKNAWDFKSMFWYNYKLKSIGLAYSRMLIRET